MSDYTPKKLADTSAAVALAICAKYEELAALLTSSLTAGIKLTNLLTSLKNNSNQAQSILLDQNSEDLL